MPSAWRPPSRASSGIASLPGSAARPVIAAHRLACAAGANTRDGDKKWQNLSCFVLEDPAAALPPSCLARVAAVPAAPSRPLQVALQSTAFPGVGTWPDRVRKPAAQLPATHVDDQYSMEPWHAGSARRVALTAATAAAGALSMVTISRVCCARIPDLTAATEACTRSVASASGQTCGASS